MKNKLFMMALCAAGMMSGSLTVQAANPPVAIYVYALKGPLRANPAYEAWSRDVVEQIRCFCPVPGALEFRLHTDDISQPSSLTSNTLWFAVRVVSLESSMFLPSRLEFVGRSSDPVNSLGKTNRFDDPTYIYAPQVLGIRWSSGGPRVSDTLLTSGHLNTEAVNEFIFIGAASKYYLYSNPTQRAGIDSYVNGFSNFEVTGTWRMLDGAGSVLAYAQKTLETMGTPVDPTLSITQVGGQSVVGINLETGQTATLQSTSSLSPPVVWNDVCTMNPGESLTFPSGDGNRFFRALLQ